MTIRADIEKQRKEIEIAKRAYSESKFARKIFSTLTYIGVASLAYLGLRALFGENVIESLNAKTPRDLLYFVDHTCTAISVLTAPIGLATLGAYAEERTNKSDVKREEQRLAELKQDYSFSRGHI